MKKQGQSQHRKRSDQPSRTDESDDGRNRGWWAFLSR